MGHRIQWPPPLNRDTDKGEHLLIGTVCQTPVNFLLMLVYVNVPSDKGEHLLIGIKFMLPDRPIYQVYTVLISQTFLNVILSNQLYFHLIMVIMHQLAWLLVSQLTHKLISLV